MTKPTARFAIDWNDDLFICVNALKTDALNVMHTGLASDPGLVNLHWNYINRSGKGAGVVSVIQSETEYGLRQLNCVTGTGANDGGYFGYNGVADDINVSNGATYTAVFWIKATVGSGTSFALSMRNSVGSTTFTISGDWQKITRTFTMSGTKTAFQIQKNNVATNVTFQATGFMIVAGSSAPNGFNTGSPTDLYDVITDDVHVCAYKLGKAKAADLMVNEGEATITLKNANKRYSPEYSSSPLYGYMKARRKFTADIQNSSGTWVRRWTGWTVSYAPEPGANRNKRAEIKCHQGKFLLDRIKFNQTFSADTTTADAVIESVVMHGFMSAATALQAPLNRARLSAGFYFVNPDDIMNLETGISTLISNSEEWVDAPGARVIEAVVNVDRGFFFIDASGKVIYYNRHHYLDPALGLTNTTLSLDTETTAFTYVYGEGYANTIRVNYYPPGDRTGIVWQSKTPFLMPQYPRTKEFKIKFEYEEGKRVTVKEIAAFGVGGNDSTISATNGLGDVSAKIGASFVLSGGGGTLMLANYTRQRVQVSVILRGTIKESYGGQTITVQNEDELSGGQVLATVSSKVLETENDARNLAQYLLEQASNAVGQFTTITLLNKTNALLDKMLSTVLGSKVTLTEGQTAHSGKAYYICGIDETWRSDAPLESRYSLAPIFRLPPVWVLGTSVLGTDTNLAY
jgi:hypothetical protein